MSRVIVLGGIGAVLAFVAFLAVISAWSGRSTRRMRDVKAQLSASQASRIAYREFVEGVREKAWEMRDINPELSEVLLQDIRQFAHHQSEIR